MRDFYFYAICCSPDAGVCRYRYDLETDRVELQEELPLANANYLAVDDKRRLVYIDGNTADGIGIVLACRAGEHGKLTPVNQMYSAGGSGYCHVAVAPDGKRLYAASYRGGYIEEFALRSDGSLDEAVAPRVFRHEGHGPHKERQDMPHPHQIVASPDGKYILVNDLGNDTVYAYPYGADGIDAAASVKNRICVPGSGPRHLVFSPDGKRVYLLNEVASTLQSATWEGDGKLTPKNTIPLIPATLEQPDRASAVRITADGKTLLVSDRGYDVLHLVEIGDDGLELKIIDTALSGGFNPRDANFLGGETLAASANETSGSIWFYRFDRIQRRLIPAGSRLTGLKRPLFVADCL